jgi:SNF2 family DNA or RNA helicase
MSIHASMHDWQQTGAYKMSMCCTGPVRGVLNLSKMGAGKTRETLLYLEHARKILRLKGSFDLILAPRSTLGHWVDEIENMFAPVCTNVD